MGHKIRGVRDGTGPYRDSYMRLVKKIGRIKESGEKCPFNSNRKLYK